MATLTTVKGVNRTLVENLPSDKIIGKGIFTKIVWYYDSYTIDAADEIGTSGLVRLFNIPKNATLLEFIVDVQKTGTTGIFDIGWAASRTLDLGGVAVETADADGIIAAVDSGNAAIDHQTMINTSPGFMKKFKAEVEVQADFSEATQDGGTKTLHYRAVLGLGV